MTFFHQDSYPEYPPTLIKEKHTESLAQIKASLPQGYSFCCVYPDYLLSLLKKISQDQPVIVMYKGVDSTFRQILENYMARIGLEFKGIEEFKMRVALKQGYQLPLHERVKWLKKETGAQYADLQGLHLKVKSSIPIEAIAANLENGEEFEIQIDEAGCEYFLGGEELFGNNIQKVQHFDLIVNQNHTTDIKVSMNMEMELFRTQLVQYIQGIYKVVLSPEEQQEISLYHQGQSIEFKGLFHQVFQKGACLIVKTNIQKIRNKDITETIDQRCLIVKDPLFPSHDNILKIASVKKMKVKSILSLIGHDHPQCGCGLKIFDVIVKPFETIENKLKGKAILYLLGSQAGGQSDIASHQQKKENSMVKKKEVSVVKKAKQPTALVIQERDIFYEEVHIHDKFRLKDVMMVNISTLLDEKNSKVRQECSQKLRNKLRIYREKEEIPFKKDEQAHPINLYTSSLKLSINGGNKVLYRELNNFLRTSCYSEKSTEEILSSWEYKFSATLLSSLKKIKAEYTSLVYRGLSFQLQQKQGDIVVYKQFISTSRLLSKGKEFARQNGTLYTIECRYGKDIEKYSYFSDEQEVLLFPYSHFQVTKVVENATGVREVFMKELERPKKQEYYSSILLWVDDKLSEGLKMFDKLTLEMEPTLLFQLESTSELEQWIDQNQHHIHNPRVRISMITNMKRKEDGVLVADAGIDSIILVERVKPIPKCSILVYIGNLEGTYSAFQKRGIEHEGYRIVNKMKDCKEFIAAVCSERSPGQIIEIEKEIQKLFESDDECEEKLKRSPQWRVDNPEGSRDKE